MYKYLVVLKNGDSYGFFKQSIIVNSEECDEIVRTCVEYDIPYIIIDLEKAFNPYVKDSIIISQLCIDDFGKEGVNNNTES